MATLAEIYDWFMTGKKPTQAQFWAAWGSFWNKNESIPQSAITNLSTVLNAKTENDQFNAHKVAADAHVALFDEKEDKTQKGVANGYAPLDEFVKLAAEYLNIVDDLVSGGSTALASAETVKTLKSQVDAINILLASDNVNLDNVQEIVDAIETVQTSLSTILVNDLTTGGTTKALTAEMGKSLKALIDALYSNATIDTLLASKSDKILSLKTITGTAYDVIADDSLVELVYEGTAAMTVTIPNNSTVALPIGTVFYTVATNTGVLTIAGAAGVTFQTAVGMSGTQNEVRKYTKRGTNIWGIEGNVTSSADMILANTQTVFGLKTFLNGMFGLRNVADTFTSFFTTAATASRTWTLQNRNGTLLDDTDLATINTSLGTKQSVFTGVTNYITKSLNSTTLVVSRLFDNGTFFGIGTVNTPIKDIALGHQANREIGIEDSINTTVGRDLSVTAGRAINFVIDTNLLALNQTSRSWGGMCATPSENVYAAALNGDIYMQTGGSGNFISLGQTARGWNAMCAAPNGDVYAADGNQNYGQGDIYKQTGGTGNFVALGQGNAFWSGMCAAPNGDIYACISWFTGAGDIYKQTGGTGNFVALGQTNRLWKGMAAAPNGDIYAATYNGDIYKQTGGTGNFVALSQTSRSWTGMAAASNGNIYAIVQNGDLYMQTGGTGNFVALSQTSRSWWCLAAAPSGNIYAAIGVFGNSGDIYMQQNNGAGTANLNGGALIHKAGTGKGTGQSRWQVWTGQKTASGTDMQVLTKRLEVDEEGRITATTMPTYADNTAALAGGLTAGMFYRTATGTLMIVY